MTDQCTSGMDRFEEQQEQTFVERHGNVNEITVGTVLEYDDWQWALVTALAVDRDEPKLGFILLDEVGDHMVQQLETANGCRQHYDVVEHLCGGEHEYWTSVEYVVEDDIWSVLGPVHLDFRGGEDDEKELVTDGGTETNGIERTLVKCMACLNWMEPYNPAAEDHICRTCLDEIQVGDRHDGSDSSSNGGDS